MRLENLTGQVFGRLTVKHRVQGFVGKPRWYCECVCGGHTEAYAANLKRGNVTSCGCYRKEFTRGNQLPNGESGFNTLFYDYTRRAEGKGLEFSLSKDEFRKLTKGDCFYCGTKPSRLGFPNNKVRNPYVYNGVDRQNNLKGYTADNCVSCCYECNKMKFNLPAKEFVGTCLAVAEYQNRKGATESRPSHSSVNVD